MSDSVQPHRRQPTRLLHPWDSPGKNTGVGCHFLLQCMKVNVKSLSRVRLFEIPWTAAYQAPPSMGFSRQEYWSGVPLPSPSIFTFLCDHHHLSQEYFHQPKLKPCTYFPSSWETPSYFLFSDFYFSRSLMYVESWSICPFVTRKFHLE